MTQLRIPDNTKITTKISSLLNNISHSFLLYLICFLFFCKIASFEVSAQQQTDSDGTITIPVMQWLRLIPKGTPPPGLKDFAFGYSKDSNLAIIFGGTTPSGSKSGQTYLLDLTDNTWKTLSDFGVLNSTAPEARSNMIFGVDKSSSYRNAFIIACGLGSGDVLYNDVWAFDFSYKQWSKVDQVSGDTPPPMYGSIGGIDTTLATSFQTVETNTLWASHGRNATHFFTDLYALVTTGTLSPNLKTLSATWYKVPVVPGSEIPSGRSFPAGTILPNKRLALYGGCDRTEGNCALPDTYSLNFGSNYKYGNITSATPLWSKKNSCLGNRVGSAMVMNSNPTMPFTNQAIVYGGSSADGKAVGPPGEVGVLDADLGNWVRVFPGKDPASGFPPQRMGAQMAPIPSAIGLPGVTATDILLFGGESTDGTNLNDIWILRLNSSYITGDTAKSSSSQMVFLQCVSETKNENGTGGTVVKPGTTGTNTESGNSKSSGDDYFGKSTTPKSHVTFSTISFACLPLAASIIRFGYGLDQKWAIAGLYTILIAVSYATAFYGFAIAYQDRQKLSGHFNSTHGLLGLILLVLLYILVPLMAIVSLFASKKYESDSFSNDDSDNEKRDIGSKLSDFFNWRNSESNSKTAKSFEVSRPGNQSQSHPSKSSDNWIEKRKSVTHHPTMSSQGSSLQYAPSSRRTSQSTAVSRSGLQSSTTPSNTSAVIIIRRAHHVIAQIVLILTVIYIGDELITTKIVDSLYFYIFIGFMVIIYLTWIIAARYGYPKGRNSLLVLFMHKFAGGKGEINEMKQYDSEENYRSGRSSATPAPSSNRMRIEDDEMDEEAEQAQLEQDMHNREVVVMTIPKRRLTVVNA
uniref:Serine/threonine-protein phosphatase BSU1 n=1 Tax=Anthurium amnicola TaxID=1678845 RepID=A0A1D1XLJ1_9ARAE